MNFIKHLRDPKILAVLIVIGGIVFFRGNGEFRGVRSFQAYAESVIEKCKDEGYRPSCYDIEIPKLMDTISLEDAFQVTRIVQDEDPSYRYCHVLGHNLSAREVQKDPSKWKDVVSRCPSGMCSNGCIHGGFQERFRKESLTDEEVTALKPDLTTLCEERDNWHPTGLEQASCYHALGHLTMYLTEADIRKSIPLCEEFAKKDDGRDFTHLCFDGAFMQIFQPLEPEDFALIKGKEVAKDELASFCAEFSGTKKASCWTEGWPLFRKELQEPQGLVAHCSQADPDARARCYTSLVYVLTAQFGFEEEKIQTFCSGLPDTWKARCFADAATRLIETDYRNISSSVSLCTYAVPFDQDGKCFKDLVFYSTYNFKPGSKESLSLCEQLPGSWREKCLSNISAKQN